MYEELTVQARQAVTELLEAAKLKPGKIFVVGCSSSEMVGARIGKGSSLEAAQAAFAGIYPVLQAQGIELAVQCCEHLNRALVVERAVAESHGFEIVNAIPQLHAGGSFAMTAWANFKDPVLVETIVADAGIDIGGTLIGMHLKRVAVPVRLATRQIGEAMLAKETAEATQDAREWKEFAEANMVLAETLLDEKAIVTKIFEGVKEQKDNDYCAIIERPFEDMINVGARKKEKRNEEKRDNENKGKAPEKEPDLNVFRQIFKMAKKRNVNKVVIGDDLSQEAREKATVAAVAEDMKVDGKGKTKEVDLKKDYVKKLPPAVRRKVRNYNVSNLTPEERKKYREKRKILRMSGRIKPKKPEKEIKPENSFVNEKAAELQASVTGKMMPQDMSGFGRE